MKIHISKKEKRKAIPSQVYQFSYKSQNSTNNDLAIFILYLINGKKKSHQEIEREMIDVNTNKYKYDCVHINQLSFDMNKSNILI